MKPKILLLIIDMQNDFCLPNGALYVRGAEDDTDRLGKFISEQSDNISHIVMTQDNHYVTDISHPGFWEDSNGNSPAPYTKISLEEVLSGTWKPRYEAGKAVDYIGKLEQQGEFPHTIWPEHCIIGSAGAAITGKIMDPVTDWSRKGRYYDLVVKGTNPLTEHFGALMANVPDPASPETQLNKLLVDKLRTFDTILLAGEAKSHCVATTLKQMLNINGIAGKLVILEDCMSDVPGFETLALPIYENARLKGVEFNLSTEWQP